MVAVHKRDVDAQAWRAFLAPVPARPYTVADWVPVYLEILRRKKSKSIREAETVYALVSEALGDVLLPDLTQAMIVAFVAWMRAEVKPDGSSRWAHKTVRKYHSLLRTMLRHAVASGLLEVNPAADMPRGSLPPNKTRDGFDADAELLSVHDACRVISSTLIPYARRVFYAALLFTGAREAEVLGLRWKRWIRSCSPLSKLLITEQWSTKRRQFDSTKTDDARPVPVHAVLEELLDGWQLAYAEAYGRAPGPDDLIFPRRWKGRLRPQYQAQALSAFKADLALLALEPRRLHSLRHTFITHTEDAGADADVVFALTHRANTRSMRDIYRHWQWPRLCAAIACTPFTLFRPMEQVSLFEAP